MSKAEQKQERAIDPAPTVSVGGRERTLRFNMWSLCCLEEETGRPWYDVVREIRLDFARSSVRLLWACLQHEPNPPTIKEIAQAMPTDGSARPALEAAFELMLANLPKREASEEAPLGKEAAA